MSSSDQPVNGTAPVTPVALFSGVSTVPIGGADVPVGKSVRRTAIGPGLFDEPLNVKMMAPSIVPMGGTVASGTTLIVSSAGPVPDVRSTTSQGRVGVAVQFTVPAPACDSRTICPVVCPLKLAPDVIAPNRSDVLSSVMVGPVAEPAGYIVFRPSRSSLPIAGGTGVSGAQQNAYMMFDDWFGTVACVWPKPIVWPISCSSTRAKSRDSRYVASRSAAF